MNNANRYSSHNHHDYDDMDKLKHEHGITDEQGYHKDQQQVHHAGHDHCGHSGHDHSGHSGHAHHHHGSFKELFLKSLPLGIIIMLLVPLHGFELPFQFTFPYSDIVVALTFFLPGGSGFPGRRDFSRATSESPCLHELILSENARVWYYRETGKLKNIFRGGAL